MTTTMSTAEVQVCLDLVIELGIRRPPLIRSQELRIL